MLCTTKAQTVPQATAWTCHRFYDWAFIGLDHGNRDRGGQGGQRWMRRNRKTGELACYRCWTPRPVSLATLVRVAGRRWTTLAMVPDTFPVVAALAERARAAATNDRRTNHEAQDR